MKDEINTLNQYSLYIFDFDLTIADTKKTASIAYSFAIEQCGGIFDENNILDYLSVPLDITYGNIKNPKISFDEFKSVYYAKTHEVIELTAEIYPDVIDVIITLYSAGKKLAIVTNRDKKSLLLVLEKAGIKKYFHSTVCREDVVNLKPDKEPLEKCLEDVGVEANRAIYIGDSMNDYYAAKNACMHFAYIDRYNFNVIKETSKIKDLYPLCDEIYDIFVAYHGTSDKNGSARKAYELTNYLRNAGVYAFCHISSTNDNFGTITKNAAGRSRLFILVANENIKTGERGQLCSKHIKEEIGYFARANNNSSDYVLAHSKVYAFGKLTLENAEKLDNLFVGTAHIVEDQDQEYAFNTVLEWINKCLNRTTGGNLEHVAMILQSVATDIKNQEYVLIFGEGVSHGNSNLNLGIPTDKVLLERINNLNPSIEGSCLVQARKKYIRQRGERAYKKEILAPFYVNELRPLRSHDILGRLGFAGYISFCIDKLLEIKLKQNSTRGYQTIVDEHDLRSWDILGGEIPLFYVLGNIDRLDDVRFIESIKDRDDSVFQMINIILSQKKTLFIGFSKDELQIVFDKFSDAIKCSGRNCLAIIDDTTSPTHTAYNNIDIINMNQSLFLKLINKAVEGENVEPADLSMSPTEIPDWLYEVAGNPTETQAIDWFLKKIYQELDKICYHTDIEVETLINNIRNAFNGICLKKPHFIAFDCVYEKLINCVKKGGNIIRNLKFLIEDIQDDRRKVSKELGRKAEEIISHRTNGKVFGLYGLSERVLDFLGGFDYDFQTKSTLYIAECSAKSNGSYIDAFHYYEAINKKKLNYNIVIVSDFMMLHLIETNEIDYICFGIHAVFFKDGVPNLLRNIYGTKLITEHAIKKSIPVYFLGEEDKIVHDEQKGEFFTDLRNRNAFHSRHLDKKEIQEISIRNEELYLKTGCFIVTNKKIYACN